MAFNFHHFILIYHEFHCDFDSSNHLSVPFILGGGVVLLVNSFHVALLARGLFYIQMA